MSRVIAAVQVRMSSTRLPGKAMAAIEGRPVVWHVVRRLGAVRNLDQIVIATSDSPDCDPIRKLPADEGVFCVSGSEMDLIDRLHKAALACQADALVRITADCPLVDPEVVSRLVDVYRAAPGSADLVTNVMPRSYPHGLDAELFPTHVLARLHSEVTDAHWREWFPTYVTNRPDVFRIYNVASDANRSALRWTLDYPEDLEFIRAVYRGLLEGDRVFVMTDILRFLDAHPEIQAINAKHAVNHA